MNTNNFDKLYNETIEELNMPVNNERKFEFCLQKLSEDGMRGTDEFQTVTEFGISGLEVYNKVRNAYPGWRVYTWGIFND